MTLIPRVYVGTVGQGIFRSEDGGQTFTRRSVGMNYECDVRALVSHPLDPKVLYAATSEGLYRSGDAGERWERVDSPMNGLVVWSIAIDPRTPETLYVGTRPARLFCSRDGGRGWIELRAPFHPHCNNIIFNRVTTILSDPAEPARLWAGVEIDAIWRSDDRGESWSPQESGLSSRDIHALIVVPGGGLLASTNNDLNESRDGGRTWTARRLAEKAEWPYFRGMAQKADDPSVIFLGNGDAPPGRVGALLVSRDGGARWERSKLPCVPNSTIWGFAVNHADSDRIYAHSVSGELYESIDAGHSWTKLPREFGEIRSLLWIAS
jgi:photosystem II stability/assembly factor-like uncharacterized protein